MSAGSPLTECLVAAKAIGSNNSILTIDWPVAPCHEEKSFR